MAVLGNVLSLEPEKEYRLRFQAWAIRDMAITDPVFQVEKPIKVLSLLTSEINGTPETKTWNVASERVAAVIMPYLKNDTYKNYIFTVVKHGSGAMARYEITVRPA